MEAVLERVADQARSSWSFRVFEAAAVPFTWHFHPEFELTSITRGAGRRYVGDAIAEYRPGDLVLLGPGLPHAWGSYRPSGGHRAIVVQFRRDFMGEPFFDSPELADVNRLLDASRSGLAWPPEAAADASARLRLMQGLRPLERLVELIRLLGALADAQEAASPIASPRFPLAPRDVARRRIEQVCAFLHAHHGEPLTLAQVAAVAHLSPSAFSRFFHRALGRTFSDYLTELRIAAACRLLVESDFPIATIAHRSGFRNLSSFGRRFRASQGTTPSAFRRAHVEARFTH